MAPKRKSAFFSATQEAQKLAEKQQKDIALESDSTITQEPQNEIKVDTLNGTTEKQDSDKTVELDNSKAESLDRGKTIDTEDPIFPDVMQDIEVAELQSRITEKPQNIGTQKQDNVKAEQLKHAITTKPNSVKAGKRKNGKTQEPQSIITDTDEDKPTEKITLYLSWRQLDKLDQMALEYKRRTRQRTDHNKLMRMMVDKFSLDDLI